MIIEIKLKGKKDSLVYNGDKIEILDIQLDGLDYKQIRCFRNNFSKSELILTELINKIVTKNHK